MGGRGFQPFFAGVLLAMSVGCLRTLPDIPADANGATLSGRVVERSAESGQLVPVARAAVAVAGLGVVVHTGADGLFEVGGLPLGPLRLVITRPVEGRDPLTVKVVGGLFARSDGERLFVGDVEVRDPGALRGSVLLADAPAAGLAEGTLVAVAETSYRAIVGPQGTYKVSGVPEGGTFELVAYRAGYAPARARGLTVLANATQELEPLILRAATGERTRAVMGSARWRDPARDPAGIQVRCLSETSSTTPPRTATTQADGGYALTLEYGLYACELTHPEAQPLYLPGVAVLPEGVIGLPPLFLTPRVDPATGDTDGDGVADAVDDDRDGDGTANARDVAPDDPLRALDSDGDGTADVLDLDDDGDALADAEEVSPGRDGVLTDPLRADSDGDGVPDGRDVCPAASDAAQTDTDGDGRGDACDPPDEEMMMPPVVVPLEVRGVTPTRAGVGAAISVLGRGFATSARSNVVTFAGGLLAQAGAVSADRISVIVPAGAASGPLSVYNGLTTVTSTGALEIVAPPVVTDFSPAQATIGEPVTITGRGLLGARVFVGTTEAAVTQATDTRVDFVVPAVSAVDWPLEVRADGGSARPARPLTVLGDARIIAVFPAVAGRGQLLRIVGAGFAGRPTDAVTVEFTGAAQPAIPTLVTGEEVRVVVPDDAQTGPIAVVRPNVRAVSPAPLTVDGNLVTIRGFSPSFVQPGEVVTVTGDSLDRVVGVRVAGFPVTHRVLSPVTLELDFPASGVPAGLITVESRDANNRVVTSSAPTGLDVLRLVRRRVLPSGRDIRALVIDPTRPVAYAAFVGPTSAGATIDLGTLTVTATVPLGLAVRNFSAISPDGRWAVSAGLGVGVRLLQLPSWSEQRCGAGVHPWAAFTPDGRGLVFGEVNMGVGYVDLAAPSISCGVINTTLPRSSSALLTDVSRRMLVADDGYAVHTIDLDPGSPTFGAEVAPVWAPPSGGSFLSWSPPAPGRTSGDIAGGYLWFESGAEFAVYGQQPLRQMPSGAGRASLDRRWAVVSVANTTARFLDLARGQSRLLTVPWRPAATYSVSFALGGPNNHLVMFDIVTREFILYQFESGGL